MPSHDTYQRLWDSLSPTQFKGAFREFIESLEKVVSDVMSLDGKIIRNSGKKSVARCQVPSKSDGFRTGKSVAVVAL